MIIARNFLCRQGEIDIVALDGEEYVFMEVKTRSSNHYGNPIDAVDEKKQKHIISASKYYIYKNHLENKPIRFDIVEVYRKDYQYFINHIKNVFW